MHVTCTRIYTILRHRISGSRNTAIYEYHRFSDLGIFPLKCRRARWSDWDVQGSEGFFRNKTWETIQSCTRIGHQMHSLRFQCNLTRHHMGDRFFYYALVPLWNQMINSNSVYRFKETPDAFWVAVHQDMEQWISDEKTRSICWIWCCTWNFAFQKQKNKRNVGIYGPRPTTTRIWTLEWLEVKFLSSVFWTEQTVVESEIVLVWWWNHCPNWAFIMVNRLGSDKLRDVLGQMLKWIKSRTVKWSSLSNDGTKMTWWRKKGENSKNEPESEMSKLIIIWLHFEEIWNTTGRLSN